VAAPALVDVFQDYKPVKWAYGFHSCTEKYVAVKGGYRSSKTWTISNHILGQSTRVGGQRWLVGRLNFTDLKETGLRTWQRILTPLKSIVVRPFHGDDHNILLRAADGGVSEILFKTVENAEALGSLELTGFHVIEAGQIPQASYKMLQSRLNYGPVHPLAPQRGFLDFNPTTKVHWCYDVFQKNRTQNTRLITAPTYDNRINLPPNYIEDLEAENDGEWISRYLAGDWGYTSNGSPVFPIYRTPHHVASFKVQSDIPMVIGWDWGFRRPAAILGQIIDGSLVVFDALLGNDESLDSFADKVVTRIHSIGGNVSQAEHYGDIAGNQRTQTDGDSCISRLAMRGIHVRTRAQKIHDGLSVIRVKLERRVGKHFGLMFDERCNELMFECMRGGYHYPEVKADRQVGATDSAGDPLPWKDGIYDHMADALRYLMVGLFGIAGNSEEVEKSVGAVLHRQAVLRGTKGSWS